MIITLVIEVAAVKPSRRHGSCATAFPRSNRMRYKQSKESGFTLIELVSVLVILGIIAAVAVPKFINLTDEARQIQTDSIAKSIESAGRANRVYLGEDRCLSNAKFKANKPRKGAAPNKRMRISTGRTALVLSVTMKITVQANNPMIAKMPSHHRESG